MVSLREIDELREQSNAALAASRREIDELREQSNAALAASQKEIDELRERSDAALAASWKEVNERREQSDAALAASRKEVNELREHVHALKVTAERLRDLLVAARLMIFDVLSYPDQDWPRHHIKGFLRNVEPELVLSEHSADTHLSLGWRLLLSDFKRRARWR
jgi:DNA repair exonuclease SbcCD ATPase subunit